MFGLLAWLWDNAYRVYEFFGSLYSKIRDAALSAYAWARQAAYDAYQWARDYLLPKIAEALASALNFALGLLRSALDFASRVLSQAREWFDAAKAWAYDRAKALVNDAINLINTVDRQIRTTLATTALHLWNGLIALIQPLKDFVRSQTPFVSLLKSLSALVSGNGLTRLGYMIQAGYQFISGFLEHPIATLWGYIEPYLSDLGSYYLGYALGAVKRTLAPPPNLLSNLIILDGGGAEGPPAGAGKLAPPCSPLYISGNTFGNPAGHYGIDFGISRGQSIFAAHSGTVEIARDLGDGYARCVTIRGSNYWTRYAHLLAFHVTEGERVEARQTIAAGDSTGNSTGDHLHFEVKYKGSFINPVGVL